MTRYRCTRCKYVYDPGRGDPEAGITQGTPFSALPEGWTCPVSGAPKGEFVAEEAAPTKPRGKEKAVEADSAASRPVEPTSAAEVVAQAPRPQREANAWTVGSLKKKTGS